MWPTFPGAAEYMELQKILFWWGTMGVPTFSRSRSHPLPARRGSPPSLPSRNLARAAKSSTVSTASPNDRDLSSTASARILVRCHALSAESLGDLSARFALPTCWSFDHPDNDRDQDDGRPDRMRFDGLVEKIGDRHSCGSVMILAGGMMVIECERAASSASARSLALLLEGARPAALRRWRRARRFNRFRSAVCQGGLMRARGMLLVCS